MIIIILLATINFVYSEQTDQFKFLWNYPPTPPLSYH